MTHGFIHNHRRSDYTERLGSIPAEHEPTFTLEQQVASARADMGEAKWRRLNAEFDQ